MHPPLLRFDFCYYLPNPSSKKNEVPPPHLERLHQHHGHHTTRARSRAASGLLHRHPARRGPCSSRNGRCRGHPLCLPSLKFTPVTTCTPPSKKLFCQSSNGV